MDWHYKIVLELIQQGKDSHLQLTHIGLNSVQVSEN